jgi:hypothetical protein
MGSFQPGCDDQHAPRWWARCRVPPDNEAGWLLEWAAWHLVASAMHNYGTISTGSWPVPRPAGGSRQTLLRSGGEAPSCPVAEIKVGFKRPSVLMSSSPSRAWQAATVAPALCAAGEQSGRR